MKIYKIFLLAITLINGGRSQATTWRVNNNGYSANFKEINEAIGSNQVSSGDTLHVEGSTKTYESATITKRLVIIGPGFFLTENPELSLDNLSARITNITFNPGSDGSQIMGLHFIDNIYGVAILVSNILVRRCLIDCKISVYYDISDIRIIQNFIRNEDGTIEDFLMQQSQFGFPTGLILNNNIIQKPISISDQYSLAEVSNNVFDLPSIANEPSIKLNAAIFQNNIVRNPDVGVKINAGNGSQIKNNIGSIEGQFGVSNNNIVVSDFTTLWDEDASSDGKYQLKANSPGSGKGSDGTDIGAFGGPETSRYTLSGLPPIPVNYEVTTTGVAGEKGLPVVIKARTIK